MASVGRPMRMHAEHCMLGWLKNVTTGTKRRFVRKSTGIEHNYAQLCK